MRRPRRPAKIPGAKRVVAGQPVSQPALDLMLLLYEQSVTRAAGAWMREHGFAPIADAAPKQDQVGELVDVAIGAIKRNIEKGARRIPSIDPNRLGGDEDAVFRFRARNVQLIETVGDHAIHRLIGTLAENKGLHVTALTKKLQEVTGVEASRARLWARDQTLKLHADLTEAQHVRAGIKEYDWHTVGDGNVRSGHQHLNGQRFSYDDPPDTGQGAKNNPGRD